MKTIEMDIRGQVCPSCLLLVLREVNRHHQDVVSGELSLTILTDNRQAVGTIPEAVSNMGIATEVVKTDGCYRITIEQQSEK